MDTYLEMTTELLARLQVADNSTLYGTTRLQTLIKDSHLWATSLYIWHDLVKAKGANSIVNSEYYDYPTDVRTGTIVRLTLGGESYERKNFEDYLDYKKNNPNSTKKMFANYGRQYFITPTPTAILPIVLWGSIQATQFIGDTSKSIFSLSDSQGNEAIVKKAFSVAIKRVDQNLAIKEEQDAIGLLTVLFKRQQDATQRDQRIDHPFFNVPDFFSGNLSTTPGTFTYNPNSNT